LRDFCSGVRPLSHSSDLHPQHSSHIYFYNATTTTETYTLSLHDALPISEDIIGPAQKPAIAVFIHRNHVAGEKPFTLEARLGERDRKSTRLNSSHVKISYAVFCLKKKRTIQSSIHVMEGL